MTMMRMFKWWQWCGWRQEIGRAIWALFLVLWIQISQRSPRSTLTFHSLNKFKKFEKGPNPGHRFTEVKEHQVSCLVTFLQSNLKSCYGLFDPFAFSRWYQKVSILVIFNEKKKNNLFFLSFNIIFEIINLCRNTPVPSMSFSIQCP